MVEGSVPPRERPFGVSLLAFLALLSAVITILVAPVGGWVVLALVLVSGALAYGLWELKSWAWTLALLFWAFGFVDALWMLGQNNIGTNLIVGPAVVVYLRNRTSGCCSGTDSGRPATRRPPS
ncbi:MAG: hypothetical protein HY262_01845 [Chloroflexi bacterium]|nr:hypothetical protein [Chloroflexota bacterium]